MSTRYLVKQNGEREGIVEVQTHLDPERPLPAIRVGDPAAERAADHRPGAKDGHHDALVQPSIAKRDEVGDDHAGDGKKASSAELASARLMTAPAKESSK